MDFRTRIRRRLSDYLNKSESSILKEPSDMDALAPLRPALPVQQSLPLAAAARAADAAAARTLFIRYRDRVADETRRRHDADLALFAQFCTSTGASAGAFAEDATAWSGVSWGLVAAFVEWMLQQGYAVGSVNVRLSTVRAYAKLATQAGALSPEAYAQIKLVTGLRHVEGMRVDKKREKTRTGAKKAEATHIEPEQAARLKAATDPADRLLMCLLLDHGFRVGEVALLTPKHFDLRRGQIRFYRPKVDKTQTHTLTKDTRAAAEAYLLEYDGDPSAPLYPVDRTVRNHVRRLGRAVGLDTLSPHDCRHYFATAALANGTQIKALQDAGGWNSPAMPLRYAESAEIANDGVKLD